MNTNEIDKAVTTVLGAIEPDERDDAKEAIRQALVGRASRRHIEKHGGPPTETKTGDLEAWRLLSEFERRVWRAVDD